MERVKTLDPILDEKEEKIKNCIDIMRGVLEEIQVKKGSNKKGTMEEGPT